MSSESTFQAAIQKSRRFVVPTGIYKAMGLQPGEEVLVTLRKKEKADQK